MVPPGYAHRGGIATSSVYSIQWCYI